MLLLSVRSIIFRTAQPKARASAEEPRPATSQQHPSNGPAGATDRYLQYTSSGGGGSDSRLIIFNQSQWQGSYTNAGITGISLELKNFGSTTLSMRLAFFIN